MEGLILTAGTPGVLAWGTLGWGIAGLVVALGAVPLGLAISTGLRKRWRITAARLRVIPGGKTLRPHAA